MNIEVYILLVAYLSGVRAVWYTTMKNHGKLKYKEMIHKTSVSSLISCTHKCRLIDTESEVLWDKEVCNCMIWSENEEENEKEIAFTGPVMKKKAIWKRLLIQMEERPITEGHLQADIAKLPKEYVLSHELKPTSWIRASTNALLITNGHKNEYGMVTPKIGFYQEKLWIASAVNLNPQQHYKTVLYDSYLNQWMKIRVSQRKTKSGEYEFVIEVNGEKKHSVINNYPGEFFQLKCYTSRIDFTAQKGFLRNIWIDILAN